LTLVKLSLRRNFFFSRNLNHLPITLYYSVIGVQFMVMQLL